MKTDTVLTPLRRFLKLLREEKKEVYGIYFYSILNGLVSLSLPLGIQAIFSFILAGRISTSWIVMVVIVAVGIGFGGFLQISQLYMTEKLQQRIFVKAGFGFAFRLPRLKLDELRTKYPPELVNRFFDAVTLQKGTAKLLVDFSTASIQVIFGLILLSIYHPFFIIFGVILIFILYLIFYFTSPRGMDTALNESTAKYEVAFWLEEIARTLSTFKLGGNSDLPFIKIDKLLEKYVDFRNRHFGVLVFQYKVLIIFKILIVSSLLIVGSLLLINNEISIGQFVAAEIIIVLVVNSVEKLILTLETVYDTLTAAEKMGKVMDLPLERQHGREKSFSPDKIGLSFEVQDLYYKSRSKEYNILKNVSFKLDHGEKAVLTGKTGSGKTSILDLLAGLYDDYEGRILVNGLSMDTMNLEKYRAMVGDSLSFESIFHGTIRENITLGKDITDEEIRQVVKLVGFDGYLYNLPHELDTQLMPEGRGHSKAVISKIILVRCLVCNPRALLLEEMFIYFDEESKLRVIEYIFKGEWTILMISNDPDVIKRADRVLVIDDGQLKFDGSSDGYFQMLNQ